MSYISCPHCCQKALSVATRCPGCGRAFDSRFWQTPPPSSNRRIPAGPIVVGVVVAILAVSFVRQEVPVSVGMSPPPPLPAAPRPEKVAAGPRATAPRAAESSTRSAEAAEVKDSVPAGGSPDRNGSAQDSQPIETGDSVLRQSVPPLDSASSIPDSVSRPSPGPAPADADSTELRFASTWVNVRAAPSGTAPVVRILEPGDTVEVDSLKRGWYRAVNDGQTLGYVARSLVRRSAASVSH